MVLATASDLPALDKDTELSVIGLFRYVKQKLLKKYQNKLQ